MRNVIFSLLVLSLCACGSPYKNVPLAAPLSYEAGEQALAQGKYEEAAQQFRAYLADNRKTYRARAYYQLARAQYHMEDYQGANESLAALEQEFPGFGNKQTEALKGDLSYALGDPIEAILSWEAAYDQSTTVERDALRPRIARAMDNLSSEEATQLASMLTVPQIYEMAIDRVTGPAATSIAMAAPPSGAVADAEYVEDPRLGPVVNDAAPPAAMPGELSAAEREALAEVPETPADSDDVVAEDGIADDENMVVAAVAPDAVEDEAESTFHIGPKVAALLPLTGSAKESGRAALATLRESLDDATLVTRDTGSNPSIAAELYRGLAADRDVVAVLGPITPAAIDAVKREAQSSTLPVLPLRGGRTARSVSESPARTLAAYVVNDLKITKIGILAPDQAAANSFTDAASSMGANLVGTHLYGTDELDLNAVLAAVQTWIDAGGVEAVYVADPAPRGVTIAKGARAVAPELVLLGDSTWANPAVLASDGTAIEGAVVAGRVATVESTSSQGDAAQRAADALQRAIALGETDRNQTRSLLSEIEAPAPSKPGLVKIVGGRATAVQ